MKILFKTIFGSHLYGLNTPQSDMDIKGVYIPNTEDILLQRCPKTSIRETNKVDLHSKSDNSITESELFTLQAFIRLCDEGQMVVLDMLFSPKKMWLEHSFEWEDIVKNRDTLIHKNVNSFIGYARKQCSQYGLKGTRVNATKATLEYFESLMESGVKKLNEVDILELDKWIKLVGNEFIKLTPDNYKKEEIAFLEVNNRKLMLTNKILDNYKVIKKIDEEYGHRAVQASKSEGVDWKAVSHAIRCINQAKELLSTGFVTFPRPEAKRLLAIKKGEVNYPEVANKIENGLEEINKFAQKSQLRESIDKNFWEQFVIDRYRNEIGLEHFYMYNKG